MYLPHHFEMSAVDAVGLAQHVGVGHLVTAGESRLESSLIPFVLDDIEGRLVVRAHIAAANPQRHAISAGSAALLIVHGPDSYVSPSLYPSKAEHGRVVPTWNYAIVHLHGSLRLVEQHDKLLSQVTRLTDLHESRRDAPWSVEDAPPGFIDGQLKAIVGLEMHVDVIEGKAKLSQNRPATDRSAVRAALLAGNERQNEVGAMMP
jgi:transcriptional regulator